MEEDTDASVQIIGKLEPVDHEEEEEIIQGEGELDVEYPSNMDQVVEEIHITTNTDGNLQINTYQIQEEIVDNGEYGEEDEDGSTQHMLISEDGTYIDGDGQVYMTEVAEYEEGEEEGEEYEQQTEYQEERYIIQTDEYSNEVIEEEEEEEGEEGDEYDGVDQDPDDPDYMVDEDSQDNKQEESNPCTICQRSFRTTASLKRHITVTHGQEEESTGKEDPLAFEVCACCGEPRDSAHTSGTITCKECDKLFAFQANLIRHRALEHPDDNGLLRCCDCTRAFQTKEAMAKHMMSHPLAKPYSCKVCNRDFTRKYHLDRHVLQTGCDGTPRHLYKCQVCQKSFTRKDNLRDHLRGHAGQIKKKKVYPCSYCQREFQGSALLQVHLRTHTGEKPYPCDMCPKRFPSSGAMKKHRRMHTGEKPYQCIQCKRRFAAKETLNRHVRTHTGDKPHVCTYCGKAFIQAAQLRAHIFHHTGENAYTCPHCNRAFNRRLRLTTHMRFVHEGAPPMKCNRCDRTFYRKEDLARHTLLHSGEKPFECEVCKKCFAVKASLKLHALTHRKEDPCSCDECGRAFIRQDCLMRHMRMKHRDVLEDIMASAEKKRLQQQLLSVAENCKQENPAAAHIWDELTLTESIKELLGLLVDEMTLTGFGWPEAPVDRILDSVIKRCGHQPASDEEFDYISRMRENAKLLFTVVIDDQAVKSLLNNQTVDEVIQHVLRLAKNE